LSEGISVRSLVGRYLEHSRVYRFGHGGEQGGGRCYIGSADLMPRNLDRRVEVLVPIHDPDLRRRIDDVLDLELADDVLAWELVDRTWTKVPTSKGIDTHLELQERVRLVAEVAAPGEGRVEGRELRR
jgi:polyphosphate kinase